jgi:hypothetical protein
MHVPHKLVLAGALLGLIPIGLGIAALATHSWISVKINTTNVGTYGLFRCTNISCSTLIPNISTVQGLEIAGVAAVAVGVIIAVLLDIFIKNRWIHLLPQIFLFAGPTLIIIGLLLYAKYLFEYLSTLPKPANTTTILDMGYSIILIIIACLIGFLTAIYFASVPGFRQHHDHDHAHHLHSPPVVVLQQSERF